MGHDSHDGRPEAMKAHGADAIVPDPSKIAVTAQLRSPMPAQRPGRLDRPVSPAPVAIPIPPDRLDKAVEAGPWTLSYEGFDPALEGRREALFTLGNGYFATRGAVPEAVADGVQYPGTYLAGGYNRLTTDIAGRAVENEDLVNWPNWLPLAVRPDDGASEWFSPRSADGLVAVPPRPRSAPWIVPALRPLPRCCRARNAARGVPVRPHAGETRGRPSVPPDRRKLVGAPRRAVRD